MMAIVAPMPIGKPALAVLLIGLLLFLAALLFVRVRVGRHPETAAHTGRRGGLGMLLQAGGFLAVAFGPLHTTLQTGSAAAWGQAVIVALLIGACIGMFLSAAVAMGRNWSFAPRTRADHDLVTWGPFATIRHPIYTGLFAMLLALGIAFGHGRGLLLGFPLFAAGTWVRVQEEEALLRRHFGAEYQAYAARVKRFVPRLF